MQKEKKILSQERAKTKVGNVLEYSCRTEVAPKMFLSEERREERTGLRKFFAQKGKREKGR